MESVDFMHVSGSIDLAVTCFELSEVSSRFGLFPTVTVWSHVGNTSSSEWFSFESDAPDCTFESNRDIEHVLVGFSGPGGTFNIQRVDTFSVVDVVALGGTPNLLMITARDLLEFTVGGIPSSVVLPAVTVWVVVIDTSSEVDQMVGISGPNATVVTHSDVEELVALLVEDIGPAVTLGGGLSDSSSVVSFAFSRDTDELRVVA